MRIGIDIRCLMNPPYSGVSEYTLRLIEALGRIGPRHHYFLFYNSFGRVKIPVRESDNVTIVGCKIPNKLLNASFKILGRPSIQGIIRRELDLFFIPNLNFFPTMRRCKTVLAIHDLSYEFFPEFYNWKRRLWHRAVNPYGLIQRADKVIAVSEHTRNDIVDFYGFSGDNIEVIHSGIRQSLRRVSDESVLERARREYGLPRRFILFLGTLEPRKNIVGLMEAYERMIEKYFRGKADYDLVLAGGKGWLYQSILEKIKTSPLQEHIHWIGYVKDEDKSALYSAAALFVYPSFYEGFGFPVLEALACRTPAVTSYGSSLGEIASPYAILTDPYNIDEMAYGMYEGLGKRITDEDAAAIRERFSWEKTARQTLAVFENII